MAIGIGLVGYGAQFSMGKHHSREIEKTEGLALGGVYDVDPARRAAAAEEQSTKVFDSYDGLLADNGVEMVVLVTPHDTHAPLSIAASRAGKHVMTEKVMCLTAAEADAMISAANEAGKMLTIYQNRRWDGDFLTVKGVVNSGVLGRIFQIESSVNGWWLPEGWRAVKSSGGGMLYDWGAHLVDQVLLLAAPALPKTVFAVSHAGAHAIDIETQTTVTIVFDNGMSSEIDVGCMSYITRPRWLIRGEKGALSMPDWEHAKLKTAAGEEELTVEKPRWEDIYTNVSRHLNHGEKLDVLPEQGRLALSVIDAAFLSAEKGQSVEVS